MTSLGVNSIKESNIYEKYKFHGIGIRNSNAHLLYQFSGHIKWLLSWRPEISYLCDGKFDQGSTELTEFVLRVDATVTRAINGQKVSAFSHSFVTSQALNMGFSVASPATFYTDMPFDTWVIGFFVLDIAT